MLSEEEARHIVRNAFPDRSIVTSIDYREVYLFLVLGTEPLEGDQDPFFSVDKTTGELRDFSIITDGDPKEITAKFLAKQRQDRGGFA
jgi:hypothetical protein